MRRYGKDLLRGEIINITNTYLIIKLNSIIRLWFYK